eukprot:8780755-Pyramimonas_sp.AAC.1
MHCPVGSGLNHWCAPQGICWCCRRCKKASTWRLRGRSVGGGREEDRGGGGGGKDADGTRKRCAQECSLRDMRGGVEEEKVGVDGGEGSEGGSARHPEQ